MKDDYPHLTPFNYADNNPVSDLDIDGRQNTKSQKRPGGIPEIPQFPNIPSNLGDFVNKTRPDLKQKFNKQTTKEGKRAVTNEAKKALGNFIEQTRTDLRSQLKRDFFIDKIDGQFKFDTKAALNAFKGSGLRNKEVINTIGTIKNRASAILNDPQFDTFVFESQRAKAAEAKRAYKEMLEERRAQAALDKEIRNILNPGPLGVVGQGVGLFGDFVEVAGEGLTASVFLGEAGVPIIFIGKGISVLGTGIEIADDYQRLDPELAQELAGIRGAVLLVSEGIGLPGAKKALSEGIIKEKLEQVIKSSGQKVLQKRTEQELIDRSKKNSINQ